MTVFSFPASSQPIRSSGQGETLANLRGFLAAHRSATLQADDGTSVPIPEDVYRTVAQVVDALAEGSVVTVAAPATRLSTTQAAELLGVSRPTVIKMMEDGQLPYEKLSVHRTVLLEDVLTFKQQRHAEVSAGLAEMTAEAATDREYDESFDAGQAILSKRRK
jgi:excisionase family DNA binding protein